MNMLRFKSFCYPISCYQLHGLNNLVVYQLINKLLKFSYLLVKNNLLIDADSAVALKIKFLSGLDASQSLKISRRLKPSFLHTEL